MPPEDRHLTSLHLLQGRMIDARRILAVTDFSAGGDVAILAAFRQARTTGAAVAIVHSVPTIYRASCSVVVTRLAGR